MDIQKRFERRALDDIIPYANNPRKNAGAVSAVVASIQQTGNLDPIEVDEDGVILSGHTRLEALRRLKYQETDVVVIEGLSEEQKRKYRILANKTNELAQWDSEKLLQELEGLDFEGFDFGFDAITGGEPMSLDAVQEDEPPKPPEIAISKPGDLYILGEHRILCGDSTNPEDVARLVDGAQINLLLTDPPYNVDVGSVKRPRVNRNNVRIKNDNQEESAFIDFLARAFGNADAHMAPGAALYIFYAGLKHTPFDLALRRVDSFNISEQLVWVKAHFVLGKNSDYQWRHEPIIYGFKAGAAHYFVDSRLETTVIEDGKRKLMTLKKAELIELCKKLTGDTQATTVIVGEKPNSAEMHPTFKPQSVLTYFLRNSSKPGWNVLDLFGGSGSTLIACEQMGRKCFMMELDPHYVDVIVKRWEDFTGRKAQKV